MAFNKLVASVACLVAVSVCCCRSNPIYLVSLPRELQCCKPEKVLVSVFTANSPQTPISLQVSDDNGNIVTQTDELQVTKGTPEVFSLIVPCNDLSAPKDPTAQRSVTVKAISSSYGFLSSTRVAVRFSPSLVLIQTDKPVYTKNDEVNIRVAVLDCNFVPCCSGDGKCVCDIILDIKNPQNLIIDRMTIKPCASGGAIKRKKIKLGPAPIEGDWTIIAKRTCDDTVVSETNFEVKNYVLPRFDIKLAPPKYIKAGHANIEIGVSARYTYGKGVVGFLDMKLGICNDSSTKVLVFKQERFYLDKQDQGSKHLIFPNAGYEVFPLGQKLCVIAEATEKASGIKYGTSDNSAVFTDNPIKIDCDLTPPFYRPNLPLQMQIRARYPNGDAVGDVEVRATQPDGGVKRQTTSRAGLADIAVDVGNSHGDLEIQVNVKDQVLGIKCLFKEFCSPCNGQITVRPKILGKHKVGTMADFEIIKPNDNRQLSITAIVVARGSIQSSQSLHSQLGSPVTTFQVPITPQLANRFCVLVYYLEVCNQVIADVACVETDKTCANEISLNLDNIELQPGGKLAIDINVDCPNSDVALLAVDKGLYILNNENRLSRDKLFQALDSCSRSCGHTIASSEGIFDAVGLAGISPTSTNMNPTCGCCTQSCRNACLQPEDQCSAAGRKKRSAIFDNQCNELSLRAKNETDKFRFCLDAYFDLFEVRSRGTGLSETDALELYTCCLGMDPIAIARGRSNVPSDYKDIIDAEDPTLIRRRTSFPHVWLQDENINNGERTTIKRHVTVPDSITEWSIYGLAQCCATGFCVSEPVSLKVFKPVFVECHLPYSLKRQEQVSIACSVYNYNAHPQRACLKLIRPPENLCTSAGAGEETAPVCFTIAPADTHTVLLPVLPLEVGTTTLTVRLVSELGGDEIEKDILVEPEGITRDYDYRAELDPQGVNMNVSGGCIPEPVPGIRPGTCYTSVSRSGSCENPIEGIFTKDVCCRGKVGSYSLAWSNGTGCERCEGRTEYHLCGLQNCPCGGKQTDKSQVNYFYVRAPEDYIEGSAKAWFGVSGRYFTIGEDVEGKVDEIHGIEGMLRMPGGCGEQSMIIFGPNCAIITFLAATNPGSEAAHLEILREGEGIYGYQYQLQYRKDNGGFCVWHARTSSTWLSSFVLRTMCCAREHIEVDPNIVSGLIDFLGTRQNANGQVVEPENVIHREMVGGVQESGVSMTAYTVMSLLECCSVDEKPILVKKVCPAVQYMQNQVTAGLVNRPYAQAIVYLALIKACNFSDCGICSIEGVCDMAIIAKLRQDLFGKKTIGSDGSVYWEADTDVGQAYWYRSRPAAISVEMTAYILEACLAISDCPTAASIAKWLNSARNSQGAFVSTQDTVVALNALSKFAAGCKVTTNHPPNLCVKVTRMSKPDNLFHSFNVTAQNAGLTQRIRIQVNDVYKVETCGTGLGQSMVHVEYNVPGTQIEQCAFNMTVHAQEVRLNNIGEDHNAAEIEFCVRYLGNNCTSMAVVEVELPTGYQPCEFLENNASDPLCLRDIQQNSGKALQFSKYEVTGKSVVFYFDHLCNDSKICIKFKAYRKFEVIHSLPVSIKAYDYYEPDEQCTDFYTLGGGSPELGLICDRSNSDSPTCVCGAGRCPKLEEIHNRLCHACAHHHFVYIITVDKVSYINGWWKYEVTVDQILKPGRSELERGDKINLWLPSICKLQFDLQRNKKYHLLGRDWDKFVLDHNTRVEPWPESTFKECYQDVIRCIEEPCKKFRRKKDIRACEKRRKPKCEKNKNCDRFVPFDTYVSKLEDGGHCELHDICDDKSRADR